MKSIIAIVILTCVGGCSSAPEESNQPNETTAATESALAGCTTVFVSFTRTPAPGHTNIFPSQSACQASHTGICNLAYDCSGTLAYP